MANDVAPRAAFLQAPNGDRGMSAVFFGTVDELKTLATSSGYTPLYIVRVSDVKPDTPDYFNWLMWKNGIDYGVHGHA